MKIKLTKIGISKNPVYQTSTDKSKVAHELGDESPWVDYTVIGETEKLPEVGEVFNFWRTERNGVEMTGWFSTSRIQAINKSGNHWELITKNSIYKLEIL